MKWSGAEVSFINATFQDNTAFYGHDIASFGIKLSGNVVLSESNETAASGYPLQLVFELQDHYSQRVTTASTQDLQLSHSDQVSFLGNTATTNNQGIFNFSQLTVYAKPNSTQAISGTMATALNGQAMLITSVEIHFRDCEPGEVRKVDRCEYCFAGKVSFSPSDTNCTFCPKYAFCPGGNVLLVDLHYWRNTTYSTDIVKCPLKENCLGGQYSECAEGYSGQVCNECIQDYTRYRTLACEPCGNHILQWMKVALIAVPIVGFNVAVKTASDVQFFVLKQILNHAQLLSVLSYIRVSYPAAIKYSLHSLSYLSSLFITELPISCFSSSQAEYTKAIIGSAITPAFYLVSIFLNRSDMKKAWILCTSTMMFTPLVSLATQVPLLACQSVLSGEELLFVDMQERCWEGRHLLLARALIIPSAILNVILPIFIVAGASTITPEKFDELFPLWRSGVKWRFWNLWIYCGKVVLTSLIIVSITTSQLCQVAYGLVVLIVVSVVAASLRPYVYDHWKLFFFVEYSFVIVAVSLGLSAYFIYHSPSGGATSWIINSVFLSLNGGYFIVCMKMWRLPPKLVKTKEESASPRILLVPQMKEESASPRILLVPQNSMADPSH